MGDQQSTRLSSLDGLRGVAAFVVLLMHVMLTSGSFDLAVLREQRVLQPWSWEWWLTYSPAHLFWDGTAGVYIFFVLSGVVLTLPAIRRGPAFSWRSYYPKRLLRLYVPVWVAVVFGTILAVLIPRASDPSLGAWLSSRPDPSIYGVFKDLVLVSGPSDVISPLWTLQWEMLFSLLLPLYVFYVVRVRVRWAWKATLVGITITAGLLAHVDSIVYMSMFAIGCLVAAALPQATVLASRLPNAAMAAIAILAALLISSRWMLLAATDDATILTLAKLLVIFGALLVVLLAALWRPAIKILELRPIRLLGTISFSLYLVHEPVVLAFSFGLGPMWSWLAVPSALIVAGVFYRYVEKPSHRFAQAAGRHFDRRTVREAQPVSSVTQ
jgi:peptidoglycan/LPS O-acetylase OafA/YrhL